MFSSLEDARSDSSRALTHSLSALCWVFLTDVCGTTIKTHDRLAFLAGAQHTPEIKMWSSREVGEVPVIPAILDVISSVSMTNTESIISP